MRNISCKCFVQSIFYKHTALFLLQMFREKLPTAQLFRNCLLRIGDASIHIAFAFAGSMTRHQAHWQHSKDGHTMLRIQLIIRFHTCRLLLLIKNHFFAILHCDGRHPLLHSTCVWCSICATFFEFFFPQFSFFLYFFSRRIFLIMFNFFPCHIFIPFTFSLRYYRVYVSTLLSMA